MKFFNFGIRSISALGAVEKIMMKNAAISFLRAIYVKV